MTITCPQLLMSLPVAGGVWLAALKDDHHLSSAVDVSVAGGAGLAVLSSRMTITCPQLLMSQWQVVRGWLSSRMTITCPQLLMSLPVAGGVGLAALKDDHHLSSAVDISLNGRWCGAGCPQG